LAGGVSGNICSTETRFWDVKARSTPLLFAEELERYGLRHLRRWENAIKRMICGMIRSCMVASVLTAALLAQRTPAPKVRIVLPEGVRSDKMYVRYGLRKPSGTYSSQVAKMPAGVSSVEIPAPTDRFKALAWAPECKLKEFDVPVEKSDIELQFACDPLKTVTLRGRVKSVDIIGPMTLRVDYSGMIACLWRDDSQSRWVVSCSGLDIAGIATAAVAPDGSFKIELPDLNNDPIVLHADRNLDFLLSGIKGMPFLVPESTPTNTFKVAASYPSEVIFVPVDFKDPSRQSH
jgi:hypothetical protein